MKQGEERLLKVVVGEQKMGHVGGVAVEFMSQNGTLCCHVVKPDQLIDPTDNEGER